LTVKFNRIVDNCIGVTTSIGANIAEGNGYGKEKEEARYFRIALRSAYELDNWFQILLDAKLLKDRAKLQEIEGRNLEVVKMLTTLMR